MSHDVGCARVRTENHDVACFNMTPLTQATITLQEHSVRCDVMSKSMYGESVIAADVYTFRRVR